MMGKFKLIIGALMAVLISYGLLTILPLKTQASDKYDADCTGFETVGRCADKCPADTAEGSYFIRGYDKDTGAAICGFQYYNECPYATGYSADHVMCQKFAEQQMQIEQDKKTEVSNQAPQPYANNNEYGGK